MSINVWKMPVQPWLRSTKLAGLNAVARSQIDSWEVMVLQAVNTQVTWTNSINRQFQNNDLIPGPARNVLGYVQDTTEQMVQMQSMMWRKWFQWLRNSAGDAEKTGVVPEPEQLAAASEPKRLPEEASTPIQPQPALAIEPVLSADDLTALHGVGPAIAKKLNEAGVVSFKQIAAWTGADIERVEEAVLAGRFAGRIRKDNWVEQAQEFVSATT